MKTAFLYAGQGSQNVGMGVDIYDEYGAYREVFDQEWVDPSWRTLIKDGPMEELTRTGNTQPCMALFAAGVTAVLQEKGITPDISCGLSLGEYGALYSAGVWDTKTYVELLAFRGREMEKAAAGRECAMSAIIGLSSDTVEEVCNECSPEGFVTVANYNCTGQYVICGDEPVVARAESLLKERHKAKCMRLKVGGPFHTKYMEPAGEALRSRFAETKMKAPDIPVAMNVTGQLLGDGDIASLLVKQVSNSVRFEDCIMRILEYGVDRVIEIGPGKALAGFCKKTAAKLGADVEIISIQKAADIQGL